MTASFPPGHTALPHLGVIRVEGADAATFLHNQLTQDFARLGPAQARLAAWCNAKGRMLASCVGFERSATEIWLVLPRDVLPPTLKRLSMFVLRAKATLSDISDAVALYGCLGNPDGQAPQAVWGKTDQGAASVVRLPDAEGQTRTLWCAPADAPPPKGDALPQGLWAWLDVRSGVATLSAPVAEAFVPQMLNYESVGGVNFKKGCYPGQEVVARSQFRGTLKRRAYLVHADAELRVGQEVFHSSDAEQPCGQVVQTAAAPPLDGSAGFDAIVSITTAAASDGSLNVQGQTLTLLPLPYPLLDDI